MKPAVAYYRVSTDLQREEKTIEIQQQKVREFAKRNNYHLIAEFSDDGVSGALKYRPGLRQMLDALEDSEAKCVIIYKLDRLARDLYIQEGLIRELKIRYSKQLISTLEQDLDSTDPFRKAFRQMLGVFSEFEKAMIALRLEGGRERTAQKGGWHGGDIYGFRSKRALLVRNNQELSVVKLIYELRKKRRTYRQITKHLTSKSIKTRRGKSSWRISTVRKILRNPIYRTGKIRYKGNVYQSKVKPIIT